MWPDGNEDLVICPYNRYHVVSKLKIQRHLMKCKKNYPDVKLASCFYNFTHKLKPEDMLKHYETCSHRTRMESARYYDPGTYNPMKATTNDEDDQGFSFPKITARTGKNFYNPHKYSGNVLNSDFECEDDSGDSNLESKGNLLDMEGKNISENDLIASSDDDSDDMEPLPLPKTVSKAFTCIKQSPEKQSIDTSRTETSLPRGFGRAKNILRFTSPKPPNAPDHSFADKSVMESVSSESKILKFPPRSTNSCSASVASSLFDDATTLASQDIIFDDDVDDDDAVVKDGLFLKNFDKYVKIK